MNKNSTIKAKDLLTPKEATEMLGISGTQLRELAKEHGLKKIKDRLNLCHTYYLKSEVEEFLSQRYFVVGGE